MSDWTFLNRHRLRQGRLASDKTYGFNGAFAFAVPGEARLVCVIASDGLCWQHVSVSFGAHNHKIPSWEIMCRVKDLFWEPEDWVVQFHPAKSQSVNFHPGCLHLWRPLAQPLPTPPAETV